MARPSQQPIWDSNQTNVTATPSAQQTDGWTFGQIPPSGIQNYWQNLVYLWIAWLAAGILDGNWEFTGNVQVDGTMTFGSDVTLNANHNVILSGSGKYKRGSRTTFYSAAAFQKVAGSGAPVSANEGVYQFASNADVIAASIVVRDDEHVSLVRAKVSCQTGDTVTLTLREVDPDNQLLNSPGPVASSGHAGATENLDLSPNFQPSFPAAGYRTLTAVVKCTAFTTGPFFRGLEVTTDVP